MTEEMGKTLDDGRAEIEKCAVNCDWFADHAHEYLADEPADIGGGEAFVTFNPLGIVLAVMPWNFPFWQVFRFIAPALMAGNGAILKHASNVPGCALAIEQVLHDAGIPTDLFRTMLLPSRDVEALIKDDTSPRSRSRAASRPAKPSRPRRARCSRNASSSSAAPTPTSCSRTPTWQRQRGRGDRADGQRRTELHRGQALHRRSLGPRAVRARVRRRDARLSMGDPTKEGTKLGPMQSVKARDEIHEQVEQSIANGARLLLGGEVPDRPGAWYPATVLADVRAGQPAHDEEVFGPVAAIIAAEDEADAIRIANASEFGLGSGVLTADPLAEEV